MFRPVNRFILIEVNKEETAQSLVVLPEGYKPQEERYVEVTALAAAEDVRFPVDNGDRMIIDGGMVEQISVGDTIYNVILDNYVIGFTQ